MIKEDCKFMQTQGLMDYSLLLVIERKQKQEESRNCLVNGSDVYKFCIIDILQRWDLSKKMETFFKTKIGKKDYRKLSSIEPV